MPEAAVVLAGRSYSVIVKAGALDRLGSIASRLRPGALTALVTDSTVDPLLGERAERSLRRKRVKTHKLVLPAGEATKTIAHLESLCREFAARGMDRHTLVVALGGGVVTDLAGFAAAVYLRGIGWIAVPTTLQGQLDAAIGGKTGVNLPEGKNLVGAFHQPLAVIADPDVLKTLPDAELRSGLAEAVKCGIIGDPELFAILERDTALLAARTPRALEEIVLRSVRLKAEVVSSDERESGRRAVLNLGHTIGHAIEAATGYGTYRHGEAVAIGLLAACRLGARLTGFPAGEVARVEKLVVSLGLPVRLRKPLKRPALLRAMASDKKREGGEVKFVLPEAIGRVRVGVAVPRADLGAALRSIGA